MFCSIDGSAVSAESCRRWNWKFGRAAGSCSVPGFTWETPRAGTEGKDRRVRRGRGKRAYRTEEVTRLRGNGKRRRRRVTEKEKRKVCYVGRCTGRGKSDNSDIVSWLLLGIGRVGPGNEDETRKNVSEREGIGHKCSGTIPRYTQQRESTAAYEIHNNNWSLLITQPRECIEENAVLLPHNNSTIIISAERKSWRKLCGPSVSRFPFFSSAVQ